MRCQPCAYRDSSPGWAVFTTVIKRVQILRQLRLGHFVVITISYTTAPAVSSPQCLLIFHLLACENVFTAEGRQIRIWSTTSTVTHTALTCAHRHSTHHCILSLKILVRVCPANIQRGGGADLVRRRDFFVSKLGIRIFSQMLRYNTASRLGSVTTGLKFPRWWNKGLGVSRIRTYQRGTVL